MSDEVYNPEHGTTAVFEIENSFVLRAEYHHALLLLRASFPQEIRSG